MPWTSKTIMDQRREFIQVAQPAALSVAELARRFGISRKTAYKWLARMEQATCITEGEETLVAPARPLIDVADRLADRSRRPHHSPAELATHVQDRIVALRIEHPKWGARKLRALLALEITAPDRLPSASTVHQVLVRHQLIAPAASEASTRYTRFEHAAPNDLWQMDFKGHFAVQNGQRCHPLTVLDDHSRYNLILHAADNERTETVRQALTHAFRQYGLPVRMTMDNGSPWGNDARHGFTPLTVWLIRLGIRISHSSPFHPQTQGKDERFHRSLNVELIAENTFDSIEHCQRGFDDWREIYNTVRPHEAIAFQTPSQRYTPSHRAFPETIRPIEYPTNAIVRKVGDGGMITFRGKYIRVPKAFKGYPVALLPTDQHEIYDICFDTTPVTTINLSQYP